MKRYFYMAEYRVLLTALTLALLVTSCNNSSDAPVSKKDTLVQPDSLPAKPSVSDSAVQTDSSLMTTGKAVLAALDKKDYRAFAQFIHPTKGIRFTPYGYVDTSADIRLSREVFLTMLLRKQPTKWGTFDGSGDDISLTLPQYLSKFVYDVPFVKPEKLSYNKTWGIGNSVNNLAVIYPGLPYLESYFSGFDKKYGGLDWRSLRLVFDRYGSQYYLVALIHNQWTS